MINDNNIKFNLETGSDGEFPSPRYKAYKCVVCTLPVIGATPRVQLPLVCSNVADIDRHLFINNINLELQLKVE